MHERQRTTDFYQAHYQAYHDRTFFIDASPFLVPFVKYLHRGSRILDVGCGSGRDLRWLKQQGFHAIGLERSIGLADLARRNAQCEVLTGDFETFDFSTLAVDAVLMAGSLVHVPHAKLPAILTRIVQACLRPNRNDRTATASDQKTSAPVYLSLKEGREIKQFTDGRIFYLWEKEAVLSVLEQEGLHLLEHYRTLSPLRPGEAWLSFIVNAY